MADSDSALASLDRRSPTLFLVAGALLAVFAALLGVEAFTNTTAPEDIFGPPGFFFAMVGLLGLYPAVAGRILLVSRASAVIAAVSAVGWLVITVLAIGETAGVLPPLEDVGVLGLIVVLVAGIPMVLAYILFSVISLRIDAHSRIVSLLLLAPPTIFAVMLATAIAGYTPAWSAFVIGSGQALVHLGIGFVLRTEGVPTDHVEPAPDSIA